MSGSRVVTSDWIHRYGIGALGLGLAARFSGAIDAAFVFVAISMGISGLLLFLLGEETLPRLNPAPLFGAQRNLDHRTG